MLYKRLYKKDSTGSTRVWEIHKNNDNTQYWCVYGKLNGKMVKSGSVDVVAKVKRNQFEQIVLEMESKISKQKQKKYVENVDNIGDKADKALPGFSPNLAKDFKKESHKVQYPCYVQPKLDGVRCLATKDGFFTRTRKPIEACEHIRKKLEPLFEKYPNAELDGELYSHELKNEFETIIKAVRKTNEKATEKDLELQKQVFYHIYDVKTIDDATEKDPFVYRLDKLSKCFSEFNLYPEVQMVTTIKANFIPDIYSYHGQLIEQGYEGSIIRNKFAPYEGKRTSNLLKYKDFKEDEYLVVGLNEGKGVLKGHLASFKLVTKEGNEFSAKLVGSFERLKWIWENPDAVIGKMVTVRYQDLTNATNVPRFPIAKDIRGMPNKSDWL